MNDTTHPIEVNTQKIHPSDLQHFVDALVSSYEQYAMKAKVVRFEQEHMRNPVLDLDMHDAKFTEDDVLSARIFPSRECEISRENMLREIDGAIEHYANTILDLIRIVHTYGERACMFAYRVIPKTFYAGESYIMEQRALIAASRKEKLEREQEEALLRKVLLTQAATTLRESQSVFAVQTLSEYVTPSVTQEEIRDERRYEETRMPTTANNVVPIVKDSVKSDTKVHTLSHINFSRPVQRYVIEDGRLVLSKVHDVPMLAYRTVEDTLNSTPCIDTHKENFSWNEVARALYTQISTGSVLERDAKTSRTKPLTMA